MKLETKGTPEGCPQNLVLAINQVMSEVRGVEKSLTVGTGNNSYAGVSDKDVKELLQPALVRAGLVLLPIKIEPTVNIDRWETIENWGGKEITKKKISVFTEVKVKYLLQHVSGESIELESYGHGIDSQDKSAGKSTTYALKYLLIYMFLIPTGAIDDTDKTHSDDGTRIKNEIKTISPDDWAKALQLVRTGKYTAEKLNANYKIDEDQAKELNDLVKELQTNN